MDSNLVVGDFTQLAKDIEKVFEDRFKGRPAMALAFTLPPDYDEVHWVTNVSRVDGINLFKETVARSNFSGLSSRAPLERAARDHNKTRPENGGEE